MGWTNMSIGSSPVRAVREMVWAQTEGPFGGGKPRPSLVGVGWKQEGSI